MRIYTFSPIMIFGFGVLLQVNYIASLQYAWIVNKSNIQCRQYAGGEEPAGTIKCN
jgi:hypothetical protein